jgi:hypothetical protein
MITSASVESWKNSGAPPQNSLHVAVMAALAFVAIATTLWRPHSSNVARIAGLIAFVFILVLGRPELNVMAAPTSTEVSSYMTPTPPHRLALVISNAIYPAAPLTAAPIDQDAIKKALTQAQFDVTSAADVSTQTDLVSNVLIPFLNRVKVGDIVAIYYFGHGFSHGIDNFLMPVSASTSIAEADIYDVFLPERTIRQLAAERQPGIVFIFLDACRVVIQFANAGAPPQLVAQAPPSQNAQSDFAISYAADYGDSAFAPSETDISYYTNALTQKLPVAGLEFAELQRQMNIVVSTTSSHKQKAWLYSDLESLFYFMPTQEIHDEERQLWEATLQEGTRDAVDNFLHGNRGSIYAGEAIKWLTDHPVGQAGERLTFTQVSPLSPEIEWGSSSGSVSFPKISAMLGVPRILALDPSDTVKAYANASRNELLTASPSAVVTTDAVSVAGRNRVSLQLLFGQTIKFTRPDTGPLITTTRIGEASKVITLPQAAASAGSINVGKPLSEVTLESAAGLAAIVSTESIKQKLAPAIADAKIVGWVSISTPYDKDKQKQLLFSLQATFVRYQLTRLGVPESKITVLRNDTSNTGGLRVRIFGIPRV